MELTPATHGGVSPGCTDPWRAKITVAQRDCEVALAHLEHALDAQEPAYFTRHMPTCEGTYRLSRDTARVHPSPTVGPSSWSTQEPVSRDRLMVSFAEATKSW